MLNAMDMNDMPRQVTAMWAIALVVTAVAAILYFARLA
jgi:hypothetical protein